MVSTRERFSVGTTRFTDERDTPALGFRPTLHRSRVEAVDTSLESEAGATVVIGVG
jgi:hypothetical protein